MLLINPSNLAVYGKPMIPYPPLGMLYVAAVLEKEHKIALYDYDIDILTYDNLKHAISSENPDVVGLTANTASIKSAREIAAAVKEHDKSIPVMIGGIHATMDPDNCIKVPNFDFVIRSEAEYTILNLVNHLKDGNFENIDGIWYKKNNEVIKAPEAGKIENLDELPFPARHLIKNRNAYIPIDARRMPVTPMMTSRGCPARCNFCCTKNNLGFKFRYRSPENVVAEMEQCIDEYGVKEIHICDDVFTFNRQRVLKIRDLIREKNLDLTFVLTNGVRADQVDREILQALKDMGLHSIGFGCESGNQEILNRIKKGIKLERVREAYKLSKEMGFQTYAFFIMGHLGETKSTIEDTIRFAKEINPDFPKFYILKPYPNSDAWNELKALNLIDNYDYENYGFYTNPVHHLPELSAEDMVKAQKRAYREFYLRPGKIWRHIKRLKSFAQLKVDLNSAVFVLKQAGVLPEKIYKAI